MARTLASRAASHKHPLAKRLFEIMDNKKTNLSVAADFTHQSQVLFLAEILGPFICVFKTHVDVLVDFSIEFTQKLQKLAEKHNFLIFEDRKFADIGNTVQLQYSQGLFRISDWSHITNAHPIPGDGIVTGLKQIGLKANRGLLLLAEMSSAGSLATGDYTREAYEMAKRHSDFVFGFIGQQRLDLKFGDSEYDFIYLTPGVQLESKGDSLGQQYRTPKQVIEESHCDIIIVGRGIYGPLDKNNLDPDDMVTQEIIANAKNYRDAGWSSYLNTLQ